MKYVRLSLLFGVLLAGVAGCAGPAPTGSTLDAATQGNLSVSQVVVDVSNIGKSSAGRVVPAETVKAQLQASGNKWLRGQGKGPRNARAVLTVKSISLITAAQSLLVGGESVMTGTVHLVDSRSGAVIMPPRKLSSGGGGWVLGGVVAVATRDSAQEEVKQLSERFAGNARTLIFGQPNAVRTTSATHGTSTAAVRSGQSDSAEELRVRQTFNPACATFACERAVEKAKRQAEATN